MILSIVIIALALLLMVREIVENSQNISSSVLTHGGMILFGAYLFYLNYKNERKMKRETSKNN
jgi:hypothetical protein